MGKRYKIVAYGPEKSCLTWADEDNLEDTKNTLRSDGYDEFVVEEEENKRPEPFRPEHLKRMGVTMMEGEDER